MEGGGSLAREWLHLSVGHALIEKGCKGIKAVLSLSELTDSHHYSHYPVDAVTSPGAV